MFSIGQDMTRQTQKRKYSEFYSQDASEDLLFKIAENIGKTWNECVKVDMKRFDLVKDDAHNRDKWRSLTNG